MRQALGAIAIATFGLAVLYSRPSYPQDQTPPATQQEAVPGAGAASNNAGSPAETVSPNAQAPIEQLPPVVGIMKPGPAAEAKTGSAQGLVCKGGLATSGTAPCKRAFAWRNTRRDGDSSAGGKARPSIKRARICHPDWDQLVRFHPAGDTDPTPRRQHAGGQGVPGAGVTQDSAASGLLHVRNEHANVQYRINGIVLPDGVSGFGQVLQSNFIRQHLSRDRVFPPNTAFGRRASSILDQERR